MRGTERVGVGVVAGALVAIALTWCWRSVTRNRGRIQLQAVSTKWLDDHKREPKARF